jgi:hypothetical protein
MLLSVLGLACNPVLSPIPLTYRAAVVDVIPDSWSLDVLPQPEADIAVRYEDPNTIAVSSAGLGFGFCANDKAAIVISFDRGATWEKRCALPMGDSERAGDLTLAFAAGETTLLASYLAIDLSSWDLHAKVARLSGLGTEPTTTATELTQPGGIDDVDMPSLATSPAAGSHVVLVGADVKSWIGAEAQCYTGVIYWWIDSPGLREECVARRQVNERTYNVRPFIEGADRTHAIFMRPIPNEQLADVVIVRGNASRPPPHAFDEAIEPPVSGGWPFPAFPAPAVRLDSSRGKPPADCSGFDGKKGVRIVRCRAVPNELPAIDEDPAYAPRMAYQRRAPNQLAIAVSPIDSRQGYAVWGDSLTISDMMRLHLVTWDLNSTTLKELRVVENAINPSIAVDVTGRVGFLYQQLVPEPSGSMCETLAEHGYNVQGGKWETRIEVLGKNGQRQANVLLRRTEACTPPWDGMHPWLGEYTDLQAVGAEFFGVFSASNDPNATPSATFLRSFPLDDAGHHVLSLDPFYFRLHPLTVALPDVPATFRRQRRQ